jgi:hypothetical protein
MPVQSSYHSSYNTAKQAGVKPTSWSVCEIMINDRILGIVGSLEDSV